MTTTTAITLDIARTSSPPVVYAKQGDSGTRYVSVTPTENGAAYSIESGVTARIRVLKPDNTAIYNTATISGNTVTAELTSQALAVEGMAIAEIGLYKGSQILTTFIFYLKIEKSAVSDTQIESTNEFTVLEQALQQASAAVGIANTAAAAAGTATTSANTAASTANTAAGGANTAAARANAAAEAVGEAIDGIAVKSRDTNKTYIVKFRIENGAPLAEYEEL